MTPKGRRKNIKRSDNNNTEKKKEEHHWEEWELHWALTQQDWKEEWEIHKKQQLQEEEK
jgi:hypothetical protein